MPRDNSQLIRYGYERKPYLGKVESYESSLTQGFLKIELAGPTQSEVGNLPPYAPFEAFGHNCYSAIYTKKAIDLVKENKFKEAAQIALRYYDKCYDYNLEENKSPDIHTFSFEGINVMKIANELIQFKINHFGK